MGMTGTTCQACGATGEPCCANRTCNADAGACGPTGTCQ
jgi:hypothetical protein